MSYLRISSLLALLLALPVIAFAADKQANPPAKRIGDLTQNKVSILCTKNGEVVNESELSLVSGMTGVIRNGRNDDKVLDSWIAIVIGGPAMDVPEGTPDSIAPLLKHVVSGDFQAWYYVPRADQLEFTWALDGMNDASLTKPKKVMAETTAQPAPRKLAIQDGAAAGRVCVSQF